MPAVPGWLLCVPHACRRRNGPAVRQVPQVHPAVWAQGGSGAQQVVVAQAVRVPHCLWTHKHCFLPMCSAFLLVDRTCLACPLDCADCRLPAWPPWRPGCRYGWEHGCRKPPTPICTKCIELSLIRGRCVRCEDPRCRDCAGDTQHCRPGGCRLPGLVISPRTGRCEYPAGYRRPAATAGAAAAAAQAAIAAMRRTAHHRGLRAAGTAASGGATSGDAGRSLLAQAAPAIINGTNAVRRRHPYMASLRFDDAEADYRHFCGGALIHERCVSRAAILGPQRGGKGRQPQGAAAAGCNSGATAVQSQPLGQPAPAWWMRASKQASPHAHPWPPQARADGGPLRAGLQRLGVRGRGVPTGAQLHGGAIGACC